MRIAIKAAFNGAAFVLSLPILALYALLRPVIGRDRALEEVSQLTAIIPTLAGQYIRRAMLRILLNECGSETVISFGVIFSSADARLGNRVYIGPYCTIGAASIEDDVLIGAGVHVPSGPHTHGTEDPSVPIRDQPGHIRHVSIGRDSWIGNAAVVMADVGRQSVIGAGAVVVNPIPDSSTAVGVPARVVKARFSVTNGA